MPEQQCSQQGEPSAPAPLARGVATKEASEAVLDPPAEPADGAVAGASAGTPELRTESESDGAVSAPDSESPDRVRVEDEPAGDALEELILPSSIHAPEPSPAGMLLGPAEDIRLIEHLRTRGRVNQYAATCRQDDGTEVEVELREGPSDDVGLQRESEVLATVQYAMLPRVYQQWEVDGRRYLALERGQGHQGDTLEQALTAGLSTGNALSLMLQLAQAVRRVHQAGWSLRGLTPADITLSKPLRIGSLRHAARIGEQPLQALQLAGYSAPELAYREAVSGKEDVYTLGAILYHALTGHPLSDIGDENVDFSAAVRLPGGPQLLADALAPADERIDIDALYQRLLTLKRRHGETALSLEIASGTTLGLNPTRHVNEDSCAYAQWSQSGADGTKDVALLCVADGMGGMEAGEIASQTAVNTVMQGAVQMRWPANEAAPDAANSASALEGPGAPYARIDPVRLIREAATAVHTAGQGRDLGTTITVVAVHDRELTLGHVGDTRAYLLRDGRRGGALIRLTADHSLVAAMVASGVITPEEAEGHPDSNKVLRSLGSQRVLPDTYVDDLQAAYGQPILTLQEHDWLLLCSDGVWGSVPDREIQVILSEALDHHIAARVLIDRALAAGAPDNATAIVARCITRSTL